MIKILFSLAITAIAFTANAQDRISKPDKKPLIFSIGVEAGPPISDFKQVSTFGIGGSLQGEYTVVNDFSVTLSVGYLNFIGKTIIENGYGSYKYPSTSVVPILAGAKIFLAEKIYGQGQVGMSFFNHDIGSGFTYAPGIGYMVSESFDIAIKYQGTSVSNGPGYGRTTLSFIGLRAAYSF